MERYEIKYPVQIDTSVCLGFILEKCTIQWFSVSSTSGVKNILQTNQMQQQLFMVDRVEKQKKKNLFSSVRDF